MSESSEIFRSNAEFSVVIWSRPVSESSGIVIPSRLGVIQSCPESSGVVLLRSLLESSGVIRSRPESFEVVWNHSKLSRAIRSYLER